MSNKQYLFTSNKLLLHHISNVIASAGIKTDPQLLEPNATPGLGGIYLFTVIQ